MAKCSSSPPSIGYFDTSFLFFAALAGLSDNLSNSKSRSLLEKFDVSVIAAFHRRALK